MFSFLAGAVRLDALIELPEIFSSRVKQYTGSASPQPARSGAQDAVEEVSESAPVNNFIDFYRRIRKFKLENPDLNLVFLDEENIAVLNHLATLYAGIDDYMSTDETKIINEYSAIQRKHNLYRIFDEDSLRANTEIGEAKATMRAIYRAYDIFDYKNFILNLNNKSSKNNIFYKLTQNVSGLSEPERKEFEVSVEVWERRKHLAFLSSPSLREVEKILDEFANYIRMVEEEFLLNTAYSQRAYEYWRGITEEKKSGFSKLINQVKTILAREREQLSQAMISRLELATRKHMMAAASNSEESVAPIYDDVALETLLALQKFGVREQYIDRFRRIARHTLTYGLMKTFFQFVVAYGNDAHKQTLSELFNGVSHYPDRAPVRESEVNKEAKNSAQAQAEPHEKPAAEKVKILSDDLIEKIFPQVKIAAAKHFSPERFKDYEALHASFVEKTIKYIEDNGLDIDITRASDQVYLYILNQHIRMIADRTFTMPEDEVFKENFVKLAEYFFLGMQSWHTFDANVIDRARQYIFAMKQTADPVCEYAKLKGLNAHGMKLVEKNFIQTATDMVIKQQCDIEDAMMEARLEVYIGIQMEVLKHAGCNERLVRDFSDNCKRNVKSQARWAAAGSGQLCRQIEFEENFILSKHKLIQLIVRESKRIKSSLEDPSVFVSEEKTLDKAVALEAAANRVEGVKSLSELQRVANELMLNKAITQPRGKLSFFDRQSSSNNKLRNQVDKINRLGL